MAVCSLSQRVDMMALSAILAEEKANIVLSILHGLRLGNRQLMPLVQVPPAMRQWLLEASSKEVLLSAHHFEARHWEQSLEDHSFPRGFVASGGTLREDPIKVLFINSFDPGLQFVYPYGPTEHFAASLLRHTASTDARVYDPNLELREAIRAFPEVPLHLYKALEAERFHVIVQAIFNVDHDLRLLCEVRCRAPKALLLIGGTHLKSVDLDAYFRTLPIDGAILGDGEAPLLYLVRHFHQTPLHVIPGIVTPHAFNTAAGTYARPRAFSPVVITSQRRRSELTLPLPNIWRLATYESRGAVGSAGEQQVLPYDMIGMNPVTVLTSQRCGKACYWCRSPKRIAPREPNTVVQEIARHVDRYDSLHFEDNEIWFAPDNFYRIGQQLIARRLNEKPMLAKTTTDQMTASRAAFMRDVGIRIVAFGVESFTQESLDLLSKGTTREQNHRALGLVLDAGMKAGINAIWLVPGIDLAKTRDLVLAVIPYLKRGAYLNLVPELAMGDINITPRIKQLLLQGYFRNEPREFRGMRGALDFLVLHLSDQMSCFKQAVIARTHQAVAAHQQVRGVSNVSVAVWSLYLLQSIVHEFPAGYELTETEREQALGDIAAVLQAVLRAEEERVLLYNGLL